ncbi:MAG TPA: hypothetical protein VGZ93_00190 [Candidatus Methylacidiphilales bacterium]|jgi:hypothetical protein|nr:hypothetical protein [Candidatus Methylacidiphilales bacterium]
MKTRIFSRGVALTALTALLVLVSDSSAMACAACYGDTTGSKIGNAADVGIIAMVIIMFCMLGAVAAFGWHLAYRAKHPLPDYEELLDEGRVQPNPGTSS